ncbi:hypothetical protein [Actinoplanes sp. N902-109]|uniref:hypothetical protein n=1 Tax=Actinoplanes sp. (strain N902-109) TaxID=649831 RepID=UPI0003294347|nr:hypothetical protein [Actinoplanes sp. N902-109]AGL13984.1 hypothetical protein L083_0474 [Actinoplanes sp. N902-109]
MDHLDRLLAEAGPLLHRVDAVLSAGGAPAAHPVWHQLRRVRLLPADAVRTVAALRPGDLTDAPTGVRAAARTCATVADSLPGPADWSGPAADAYDESRRALAGHLSGSPDALEARLHATADLAESLLTWMRATRDQVAETLADVLVSTQAIALATDRTDSSSPTQQEAAANIATRTLQTIGDAYDQAADLLYRARPLRDPR